LLLTKYSDDHLKKEVIEGACDTCYWCGNLKEREDLGVDWKIILKWILGGTSGGLCDYGNEPSGSIKPAGFLA
jgi:hypothetical protein